MTIGYTGPKLWGVNENAVSSGLFSTYNTALVAGGATLNAFRIYRRISSGTNQIVSSDVAKHNAGSLLVHSLRTDNISDPGQSAWASVAAGNHDSVITALITQALALDFSAGKPQHVFTSLDPETSRFVNGVSGSDDHGTAVEFIAAHRHFYNMIRAADPAGRILVGFCDAWWWYKDTLGRGATVAAVYPGDAYVDLSLGDLTYNKADQQPTWEEASNFIADYRVWVSHYGKMVGKQIMCIEGDCEDWFTSGWPTGSTAPDATKKANWFRNFGTYIKNTSDFIGFTYWDDIYHINSTSTALAGWVDGGVTAQSGTITPSGFTASSAIAFDDSAAALETSGPSYDEVVGAVFLAGTSGYRGAVSTTLVTSSPDDPSQLGGGVSAWLTWTADQSGTVTASLSPIDNGTDPWFSGTVYLYHNGFSSAEYVSSSTSAVTFTSVVGDTYFFAIVPSNSVVYQENMNIGYGLGNVTLMLDIETDISDLAPPADSGVLKPDTFAETPSTATFSAGGLPDAGSILNLLPPYDVYIEGSVCGTAFADATGTIWVSVSIPQLPIGSYVATLTPRISGATVTAPFTVTDAPGADSPSSGSMTFHWAPPGRWNLIDGPNSIYTFAINPDNANMPMPTKNLNVASTASASGQALIFEGNQKPEIWTISGWILNQADHDGLYNMYALRKRLVLVDHLERAFVVHVVAFDPVPQIRSSNSPYTMRYTMKMVCYYELPPGTVPTVPPIPITSSDSATLTSSQAISTQTFATLARSLNPLIYYRLDEAIPYAIDISGNAHDGLYQGSYTQHVAGLLNDGDYAVQFGSAGAGYVETTGFAELNTEAVTVHMGIRSFGSAGPLPWTTSRDIFIQPGRLRINLTNGHISVFVWNGSPKFSTQPAWQSVAVASAAPLTATNYWIVVAVSLGEVSIYSNGVCVFSGLCQYPLLPIMGSQLWGSINQNVGLGTADELLLFRRILGPSEVNALYVASQ